MSKQAFSFIQNYVLKNSRSILAINIIISLFIALGAYVHLDQEEYERNIAKHNKVVRDFYLAFEQYLHPLQGIASTMHYSDLKMSSKRFRVLSESRQQFSNFKGALGFGFIRKVPAVDLKNYLANQKKERPNFSLRRLAKAEDINSQDDYFIIEVVEPVEKNEKAIGLVVSDEANRRLAAFRSMKLGVPTITQSIQLVQANNNEPGFLFYLPIYSTNDIPSSELDRINKLIGWAYTPLLASEIVEFVTSQNPDSLPFQVYEVGENKSEHIVYSNEADKAFFESIEIPKFYDEILIAGQKWRIHSASVSQKRAALLFKALTLATFLILLALSFFYYSKLVIKKIEFDSELVNRSQIYVKNATSALVEQKLFLQSVVDELPAMIMYLDSDLKLKLSNKKYEEVFKPKDREVHANYIRQFLLPDFFEKNNENSRIKTKFEVQTKEFELDLVNVNGQTLKTLAYFRPHVVNNVVQGVTVIIVDITEMRRLQEKDRATQALLFSKSKLSLLGEMAGGVAHEINNPLAIINGKAQVISNLIEKLVIDDSIKNKISNNLTDISQTVMRISKIVKGLQSFSRNSENDPYQINEISEIINNTMVLVGENAKTKLISVKVEGLKEGLQVFCNKIQIEQVLMNLISNSVDAISHLEQKWVKIQIGEEGDNWLIRVVDSGLGIELDVVNKMMNPFFTTKEVGKGTGLGLSISKGIMDSHGGSLTYELHAGHTSFVVLIPKLAESTRLEAV